MSLQCRICLDEDENKNLVSPCNCSGTSKYIHTDCLNIWRDQNINTPYYNMCIDCRAKYKYTINSKECIFISNNNTTIMYFCILIVFTLFFSSFDYNNCTDIFDYIKHRNITNILDNNTNYYIMFGIITSNYLINCLFFLISSLLLLKINNKKRYLSKIYVNTIYKNISLFYVFIIYIIFSVKIFLTMCFILVFIDCINCHYYIQKHNNILTELNHNNLEYYAEPMEDVENAEDAREIFNNQDNIILL